MMSKLQEIEERLDKLIESKIKEDPALHHKVTNAATKIFADTVLDDEFMRATDDLMKYCREWAEDPDDPRWETDEKCKRAGDRYEEVANRKFAALEVKLGKLFTVVSPEGKEAARTIRKKAQGL